MVFLPCLNKQLDVDISSGYLYDNAFIDRAVGALNFKMSFGNDNGRTFSIDEMSTLFYNPNELNTANIAVFQDSANLFKQIPNSTGVFMHSLEPKDFWNDVLGFNGQNLEVSLKTDRNGINYVNKEDLQNKIVKGAFTADTFTSPLYSRKLNNTLDPNPTFFQIETPVSIKGNLPSPSSGGGWYSLEVAGLGLGTRYYNNINGNTDMIAIVSTQYDNNSFITGDDNVFFETKYNGVPYRISKLKVKINDSDRNPVASLGDKTTLFLTITNPKIIESDDEE